MVDIRPFKPFITEMCTALFCVFGIIIGMFTANFFNITIKPHLVSFAACALFVLLILVFFVSCILRGILAVVDILRSSYELAEGRIISCLPMHSSVFTEKVGRNGSFIYDVRYCYIIEIMKNGNYQQISTFSARYFDYTRGEKYLIKYGKFSRILTQLDAAE